MSAEWQAPQPQDYPHRETNGVDRLVTAVRTVAEKASETTSNLMRAMGVRARPGMLSSTDFDGDGGRTNLGTMGWMLGAADGGPSFFILNGRLVIEELDAMIDALEEQDAINDALIADLAAQSAALAVEVARINTLVAQQVDGSAASATASPSLNTTPTGYAAITFTVPAGYTRAQVMGTSSMYMGGIVASVLRTQINGANGPDMYAFTNAAYANASASHAASLTGLTGGGTFTVQSVANTTTSTTSGVIITSATVTWLR